MKEEIEITGGTHFTEENKQTKQDKDQHDDGLQIYKLFTQRGRD